MKDAFLGKHVAVFHKDQMCIGYVRDRLTNCYNVMIDDLPYVFFPNEITEAE
jgi:hypothetical protein